MSLAFHYDLTAVASLLRSQCCLSPYYWQSLLGNANAASHRFCLTSTGHLATANGAVALLDNFPSMDATEVAQAKAYGAIILAHGNMAEWAFTNAISIGSGMHLTLANAVVHSSCNTWVVQLWLLGNQWDMQYGILASACFPCHLRSAVSVSFYLRHNRAYFVSFLLR